MRERLLHRLIMIVRRDDGHESVSQALLISMGVGAMLAAGKLADVAMEGLTVVMKALS